MTVTLRHWATTLRESTSRVRRHQQGITPWVSQVYIACEASSARYYSLGEPALHHVWGVISKVLLLGWASSTSRVRGVISKVLLLGWARSTSRVRRHQQGTTPWVSQLYVACEASSARYYSLGEPSLHRVWGVISKVLLLGWASSTSRGKS